MNQECEGLLTVLVSRGAVGQVGLTLQPFGLPIESSVDLVLLTSFCQVFVCSTNNATSVGTSSSTVASLSAYTAVISNKL